MSDVLVIQNNPYEGLGSLESLLRTDGFKLKTVLAKNKKLLKDDEIYSLLLVLGGPQSANDDRDYLKDEQELIRKYVKRNIPVLGICLGSQLLAKTFGARVHREPIKEIGFYHDLQIDNTTSKLFSGFDSPFTVFHWHADTFDLPDKAERLVHSTFYANQAFQIGSGVGLQFHLEVNKEMICLWLDKTQEKLYSKIRKRTEQGGEKNAPNPSPDLNRIRHDIDANISNVENNMAIFYRNFKSISDL